MTIKTSDYIKLFARHIRRTFKNKICAIALIVVGVITRNMTGDATVLIVMLMLGIPLFLTNRNHIY